MTNTLPSHLLPLVTLQQQTVPVEVPLGPDAVLVLHARAQGRTLQGKREEQRLIKEVNATLQVKVDAVDSLKQQQVDILKPFAQKLEEQQRLTAELAETSEPEARQRLQATLEAAAKDFDAEKATKDATLVELRDQLEVAQLELEEAIHAGNAEQLAFYVKRMDLADDEGKEIPPTAEFFRENFAMPLLAQSLRATLEALNAQNPSPTPAATEG